MYNVNEFVSWALTHVKPSTIPRGARVVRPIESCGGEPWQYLFGSVRVRTTQATLDRYFRDHYSKTMTREKFDEVTSGWDRNGYATDCQGLLDAWLTYEKNDKTDINADMNYKNWCTDRGEINSVSRPFVIGEAVFHLNSSGKATHVGWICGFTADGKTPLVVEARSIYYGVVVTKLGSRFTHRGLMTKKFNYNNEEDDMPNSPMILKYASPMIRGDMILDLQKALNGLGYTDAQGNKLSEDGKCGVRTMEAVTAFANNQATVRPEPAGDRFTLKSEDGKKELVVTIRDK